jgi:outer membrane protein OmpA-like peptidoglycan-associated protein
MTTSTASLSTSTQGVSSMHTVRQRRVVLRDHDVMPFVWRGLLPLLGLLLVGLYALWPFARQTIEASVQRHVAQHLQGAGFGWAQVAVSGQQVLLSGAPPALADGAKAIQSAIGAQCPTWAGLRTCAISVVGAFAPPAVSMPSAPAAPAAAAPVAAPAASPAEVAKSCAAGLNQLLESSRIQFATGRADIAPASSGLLDKLADAAKSCPGNLRVEGHTDNVGDAEANRRLSLARADAVKDQLVQRGLNAQRVETAGFGADRPMADNAKPDGRAQNRRIEFHAAGN